MDESGERREERGERKVNHERREREYVGPITRDIFVEFLFSYSSCHLNTIPIFITFKFHMICHKL